MTVAELAARAVIALAVAGALWLLDRGLLRLEAKGWIYYRRRKAQADTLSSAFLAAQSHLEPGARHEAEERRAMRVSADGNGEPPGPNGEVHRPDARRARSPRS